MSEGIIIAIIGAAGAIAAAAIAHIRKKGSSNQTIVKQKNKKGNSIQTGIVNNYYSEAKNERKPRN